MALEDGDTPHSASNEDGIVRAYNEDLGGFQDGQIAPSGDAGFWLRYLQNPAAYGATPKVANVPDFNTWAAQHSGSDNAASDYVNTFYNVPLHQRSGIDKFLSNMPVYMAIVFGAAAAGGALGGVTAAGEGVGATAATGLGEAGSIAAGTDAVTLGQTALPWTTNPSLASLGGNVGVAEAATGGSGLLNVAQSTEAANYAPVSDLTGGTSVPVSNASPLPAGGLPAPSVGTGTGTGLMTTAAKSLIPGVSDSLLSGGLQAGLGYLSSDASADAYSDVAAQYAAYGAPARARLEAAQQPGFSMSSLPGYADALDRAADVSTRKWSATGNPAGNPTLQANIYRDVINERAVPDYFNYLGLQGQHAGLGLNTSGGASLASAQNSGGAYEALGAGIRTAFPQTTPYDDYIKMLTEQAKYKNTVGGVSG